MVGICHHHHGRLRGSVPGYYRGRLVGIMVMTTGVAVFATFAGLISSKLLASPAKEDEEKKPEVDIIPFEKQVITEWMK